MHHHVQDIISSDEDMLELLLTQKNKLGHLPPMEMHLSVELLLENYFRRAGVIGVIDA